MRDGRMIVQECLERAQEELKKIACYKIYLRDSIAYNRYEYENGEFIQEASGDRGEVYRSVVGHSEEEFVEYLIYGAVKRFAFRYECEHRRKFEDNRRQVNEIIERCYSYLGNDYQYDLLVQLKDNIHIYFDLLDYYVGLSKEYLERYPVFGDVKNSFEFIAWKRYTNKGGGIYDVAFSFEWVRYHISKIVAAFPMLRKDYYFYEEQYQRLVALEKSEPCNEERYQLGGWDFSVFERAEHILKGNMIQDAEALSCAIYMLIVKIHTKRDVVKDIEALIRLSKQVDVTPYKQALEELFVTDKYGIFWREAYNEYKEYGRKAFGV